MMMHLIFLVLAFVFFLLGAANITHPRVNFGWLGLACFAVATWLRP